MNKDAFLANIANELYILKGKRETDISWKCRVIYSAIARMALASLYDVDEGEKSISITYFKRRVEELQNSYTQLFPEIKGYLPPLSKKFYELFLYNGYFYHSPNRLCPSKRKKIITNNISFIRGYVYESNIRMSGMGTYLLNTKHPKFIDYSEFYDSFLFTENYKAFIDNSIKNANWGKIDIDGNIEYLKLKYPFYNGYWKKTPDKNTISILRVVNKYNKMYFLYKFEDDNCLVSPLESWSVDEGEYRRLACCLMIKYNEWPGFSCDKDGEVVHVKFNYLLPPTEMYFFKLFSWPDMGNPTITLSQKDDLLEDVSNLIETYNDFIGIMQVDVFNEFCNILNQSGLYKE